MNKEDYLKLTKEEYIEHLKNEFYNNSEIKDCDMCVASITKPLYPELLFGYINGPNKVMHVMDKLLNERYIY